MKTAAIRRFRAKLAADEPVFGMWAALESATSSEIAVACGVDFIVIDAEHSALDWGDISGHIRAALRSDAVVFTRLVATDNGLFRRALDIGSDGLMTPFCEMAEDVRRNVQYSRYPPEGIRAIGADRANCWGHAMAEVAGNANEHVLLMPNLESLKAWRNIDAIVAEPGCDLFFVGPADFSSSVGQRGQWMAPGVEAKLLEMKDKVRASGKQIGIIASAREDAERRISQGFRVICLGYDTNFLITGLRSRLEELGRQVRLSPDPASPRYDDGSR